MFNNLTNSLSLLQHVNFTTHINGNIIDLVFSSSLHSELIVRHISKLDLLSDQLLSHSKLTLLSLLKQKTRIIYRPIKNSNFMVLLTDLHSALGDYCYTPVVLNSILTYLLDKHAPLKTISLNLHPDTPWGTLQGLLPTSSP